MKINKICLFNGQNVKQDTISAANMLMIGNIIIIFHYLYYLRIEYSGRY
jgi:hypothetical protein